MTNRKTTRRALVMSILSLLLCLSMLIGTTFAWFTDSVTSANNIIKSGNLDITLEYWADGKWNDVQDAAEILDKDALWEPGYTEVVYLKLDNVGTLSLKYYMAVSIMAEKAGVNQKGDSFLLSDYIQFAVINDVNGETAPFASREAAVAAAASSQKISAGYADPGYLTAEDSAVYLAMVIYMPTEVGNVANHNGTDVPEIQLGLGVMATQMTDEEDSYNDQYDAGAPWTGEIDISWYDPAASEYTITSAAQLAGVAAIVEGTSSTGYATRGAAVKDSFKNKTFYLAADLDLQDIAWTPIGSNANPFQGSFDGQGHTISNLYVNNGGWSGIFGHVGISTKNCVISNLNVENVSILTNRMAGAVVGQIYGDVINCHAENVVIMATPNMTDNGYDNGDKIGGIVGWLGDNGNGHKVEGCSVTNAELGAYRDVGGIVGYLANDCYARGNEAAALEIAVDQITYSYGTKDPNAGAICGRRGGSATVVENNTYNEDDVVIVSTYAKDGLTLKQDGITNEVTLYLVPATLEQTVINVPEGVTNIGGYAFAYNQNVEKVVLSSTVTTLNDRAFRDTSASAVVLNEGLTNLSYQAFRNAANLTSVEIPSTVTTIAKEAFQNSGITSLVIPETVTTVEYGAMRDMKELVTVTIHSAAQIPVYAFRACTNLKTVILTNEAVTFAGRGMIFTNKENGDGSAITVYVPNETVAEALRANDTAAKDYGGYKLVYGDSSPVVNPETEGAVTELDTALVGGKDVILVGDMTFKASETTANSGYGATGVKVNGGVLDGNGNTLKVTGAGATWDCAINVTGGTIKNLTVAGAMRGIFMGGATGDVYIENVNISSCIYTFNSDGGNKNYGVYLTGCTLNGWTSFSDVHKEVVFTDCSFGSGSGYAFCRPYNDAKFVNCVFAEGYKFDTAYASALVFENCYYGDTLITEENAAELFFGSNVFFYNGVGNATFN